MRLVITLLLALVCPVAATAQKPGLTPNTLAYDPVTPLPQATVADLSWLAGHWRGPALGGISEEVWSAPEADSMMGMYRLMKDGKVVFYEILSIQPEDQGLVLVLKHFNADLTGWEEKNEVRRFRLLKLTPTEAWFEGMTFRRVGFDEIHVQLAIAQRDGTAKEEEFRYARVMESEPIASSGHLANPIRSSRFVDNQGCGCGFWRATPATFRNIENILFFSEGHGRPAVMNLDEKDVWLSAIDPDAEDDWGVRPGDERVIDYEACGYRVTVRRRLAPSDCAKEDEECEYLNMTGAITITAGARRETIPVIGSCGC